MDKKIIAKLKKQLLDIKEQIINNGAISKSPDYRVSSDDLADEGDLANTSINQNISFRIREQEMTKLRRVNQALEKADTCDFGHCEDCGELIGAKRLQNQPWAELCIVHAEEKEREQMFGARKIA